MVQWLRLHTSNARGVGSIPGWENKIPHTAQRGLKNKTKNKNRLSSCLSGKRKKSSVDSIDCSFVRKIVEAEHRHPGEIFAQTL